MMNSNFCGFPLRAILFFVITVFMGIDANAAEKPPLNKKVCVVHDNVFHSTDGTLGTLLETMLHGEDTHINMHTWEKANNLWILRCR